MATWIRYVTTSKDFGTDIILFDLDKAEAFAHNDGTGRQSPGETINVHLSACNFIVAKAENPKAYDIILQRMKQIDNLAET